jgi:hypothetical protein
LKKCNSNLNAKDYLYTTTLVAYSHEYCSESISNYNHHKLPNSLGISAVRLLLACRLNCSNLIASLVKPKGIVMFLCMNHLNIKIACKYETLTSLPGLHSNHVIYILLLSGEYIVPTSIKKIPNKIQLNSISILSQTATKLHELSSNFFHNNLMVCTYLVS